MPSQSFNLIVIGTKKQLHQRLNKYPDYTSLISETDTEYYQRYYQDDENCYRSWPDFIDSP